MGLYEEAEKINLLGLEVYRYGFFVMLGMIFAAAVIGFLCWAKRVRKGTGPLLTLTSILFGGLFSRLFFCLLSFDDLGGFLPFRMWPQFTGGGFSMMGVVAGVMCAGWLTARISKQKPGLTLDIAACALPAFMTLERVGEGCVPEFNYSRPLKTGLLDHTFLAMEDLDGYVLATWKLAAIVMLILGVILILDLTRNKRDGNTCILFLLLFGACSVLLESLRKDTFLTVKAFVGLQHILAAVILAIGVIILAVRAEKRNRTLGTVAVISVFAAAGIAIGLEFALDRTTFNKLVIYIVYILVLAVPVALGLTLRRRERGATRSW